VEERDGSGEAGGLVKELCDINGEAGSEPFWEPSDDNIGESLGVLPVR